MPVRDFDEFRVDGMALDVQSVSCYWPVEEYIGRGTVDTHPHKVTYICSMVEK